MMDPRRARIIDALLQHMEGMDSEDLKGKMMPKMPMQGVEIEIEGKGDPSEMMDKVSGMMGGPKEKGPMELLQEKGTDPKSAMPDADCNDDDEMSDDDLEELMKMGM